MANGTTHEQPAVDRNPAQADVEPDQLTAQGTPGTEYDTITNTADAQTDGTRNPRVMNVSNDKRAVEGISEPTATAYDTADNAHASGITNPDTADVSSIASHLADVTDTVEISTEIPKR